MDMMGEPKKPGVPVTRKSNIRVKKNPNIQVEKDPDIVGAPKSSTFG